MCFGKDWSVFKDHRYNEIKIVDIPINKNMQFSNMKYKVEFIQENK